MSYCECISKMFDFMFYLTIQLMFQLVIKDKYGEKIKHEIEDKHYSQIEDRCANHCCRKIGA